MIADFSFSAGRSLAPEDVVREVKHLPSAPKVLPHLKHLLSDGNSAMHEIVALIRIEPGIAARVLQVSNSAYFGHGMRCFTIDEAVNRVGYDQVYELVSYAVASQVLVRPLEVYGIEADELWKMSVACALAAEEVAVRTGQDHEAAYTVGLLHSVGLVAINEWALRHARGLRLPNKGYPREATEGERAAFGFTQAQVGEALLHVWDFPRSVTEPVRWQYAPRSAAGAPKMAGLLHVAKWLRTAICLPDITPPLPEPVQLQLLSLTTENLAEITGVVTRRMAEVSSLLETSTNQTPEQARIPSVPEMVRASA